MPKNQDALENIIDFYELMKNRLDQLHRLYQEESGIRIEFFRIQAV